MKQLQHHIGLAESKSAD